MKRITGKIVKSVAFVFCMVLLGQMLLPAAQVQAASRKSKALKAYKNYMQKQSKDSIFAVLYLDKDSVPELIYYLPSKEIYKIYTWKNNQMKRVYSFDLYSGEMPEGHRITHYYKKKGAFITIPHVGVAGCSGENYYVYKNNKYVPALGRTKSPEGVKYWRYKPGKYSKYTPTAITKSQFHKALKKQVGTKKATKIKYYSNTAKNRNKQICK